MGGKYQSFGASQICMEADAHKPEILPSEKKKIEDLASRFFCLEILFHIVTLHVLLGNHFNEKTL